MFAEYTRAYIIGVVPSSAKRPTVLEYLFNWFSTGMTNPEGYNGMKVGHENTDSQDYSYFVYDDLILDKDPGCLRLDPQSSMIPSCGESFMLTISYRMQIPEPLNIEPPSRSVTPTAGTRFRSSSPPGLSSSSSSGSSWQDDGKGPSLH